jgi:pimeloyl-ACP methyl ester carboxylesterase
MRLHGALRRTTWAFIPVTTAGALLLSGCSSSGVIHHGAATDPSSSGTPAPGATSGGPADTGSVQGFYSQKIAWAPCTHKPSDAPDANLAGLQCGTYSVPLDYSKPSGQQVKIAVVKWPASGTKQGSLLTNPGGPGASGVDFVEEAQSEFDATLHQKFDIIGFDPRGLGQSDPIHCLSDKSEDQLLQTDPPKDPTQRLAKEEGDNKTHAQACEQNSGSILPFIGSKYVADDMDVLRGVLGDAKLNYLGISYGTYLGSVYAEQFPKNVGRLVLDGAVDPNADQLEANVQQQVGFEKSFENFVKDCVANHPGDCPVSGDPHAAAVQIGAFLDGLQQHPLPTRDPDGRKLDSTLGWTGALIAMYGSASDGWWDYLRQALTAAMKQGDGSLLLAGSDQYNGRDKSGHYSTDQDGLVAVRCADFNQPAPSAAAVQKAYTETKTGAPILNSQLTPGDMSLSLCDDWAFQTTEKPHVIKAQGADPILVIGTTDDPATPYQNAVNLAKGFASARLLTRVGEGHGAFGSGNICVQNAMDAYLVSGTLPADGTRCTA